MPRSSTPADPIGDAINRALSAIHDSRIAYAIFFAIVVPVLFLAGLAALFAIVAGVAFGWVLGWPIGLAATLFLLILLAAGRG